MDGKSGLEKYKEAMQEKSPFDIVIMDLTIHGGMRWGNNQETLST